MQIHSTAFEGLFIIEPTIFRDNRGYFYESFQLLNYSFLDKNIQFVQDNEASSEFGVIRGLHYQIPPYGQAKLVRAVVGQILDVVIDIRPGSSTYGKTFSIELTEQNKFQLFIPVGFAHGYSVLSPKAIFSYKCTEYYNPDHEAGIHYRDPSVNIDWKLNEDQIIVSEKDQKLPNLGDHRPYE
jgi:dTDP-4-dehydrorhamnose 3,5-epimerase